MINTSNNNVSTTAITHLEAPFTGFVLQRVRNASDIFEYSLHSTMQMPATNFSAGQVFMEQQSGNTNSCDLIFVVNINQAVPNLALPTTIHHTTHIGRLPFDNQEGILNIFLMEIGGNLPGTSAMPRKNPKGQVETTSSKETM